MICSCGNKMRVIDTYSRKLTAYRYRKCSNCGYTVYTKEDCEHVDEARSYIRVKRQQERLKQKNLKTEN